MKCLECGDAAEIHGPAGCTRKRGGCWGYCDCPKTRSEVENQVLTDTSESETVTDHKYVSDACHEKGCQYLKGMASGSNYVCDDEVFPSKVTFANGRTVRIVERTDGVPGYFLDISGVAPLRG